MYDSVFRCSVIKVLLSLCSLLFRCATELSPCQLDYNIMFSYGCQHFFYFYFKPKDMILKNCPKKYEKPYSFVKQPNKKATNLLFSRWLLLTGDERIELPLRVLETPVIPLDQSPLSDNIHYKDFITYPQNRIYDLPLFLVKPSPD